MTLTRGAIQSLIKKIHKGTSGTGQKDDVPATIKRYAKGGMPQGSQPALLSEGEYVVPADCVAILGDGNTEAGAKILEQMCNELRKRQGKFQAKGKQAPPLT